jgi:hypothetical protein
LHEPYAIAATVRAAPLVIDSPPYGMALTPAELVTNRPASSLGWLAGALETHGLPQQGLGGGQDISVRFASSPAAAAAQGHTVRVLRPGTIS